MRCFGASRASKMKLRSIGLIERRFPDMAHSGEAGKPHTAAIANFVSGFRYEMIPSDVLGRIKLLVLDSLGCAIYGADLPWSRILRETLAELDTTNSASVWGTRDRLSSPHAVLVNGALVQSFELDDV